MYEVMAAWETLAADDPVTSDFAEIWRAADKIVYSRTLETVSGARTRIERDFDPEAVRRLKPAAERDLSVGGPDLAGQAIEAGLVDEYHLFVAPVVVGGGKRCLPTTSASTSSSSTNAVSATASCTSAIANPWGQVLHCHIRCLSPFVRGTKL